MVKIDTETKETKIWWEEDMFPSEPVYVPNPSAKDDEDSGVVLSICVSTKPGAPIFLLVLGKLMLNIASLCNARNILLRCPVDLT